MDMGFTPSRCVFATLIAVLSAQGVSAVSYYYPTQSFECTIYAGGATMYVSQAVTVYCFTGFVDKINVTLPYGSAEMPDANDTGTTLVRTTAGKDIARRVIQSENQTTFEVTLPDKIYAGDDFVVILRYYVYDVGGDLGITRTGWKTLGDKILGRTGENMLAVFNTPLFEAQVNELIVKMWAPLGYIGKDWKPPLDSSKVYDPATGRVGVIWHVTTNVPNRGEFQILYGRPGWGVTAFLVIGALVIVFVYLTVDMMNRLREKAERGELW